MRNRTAILTLISAATLSACQTNSEPDGGSLAAEVDARSAVAALQRVNDRALNCWIKSGDKAFSGYALVPELDTRAGNPRILVVERGKATGLPKLVIEASGKPVSLVTYGPLAQTKLSGRINQDVLAWSAGRSSCV